MKKGEILPVKIEKFALGGQGLAFVERPAHDGVPAGRLPVFVDDVCVGDEANVRIITKKNSFAEGRVQEITKGSGERIASRCMHFGVCGGCTWQFLPYEKQLAWKEQLVKETLRHVGGLSDEVLHDVFQPACGCDDPWFYRNKMEWSFSTDRDGAFSGGFHVRHMHYDTVNVQECFLQSSKSVKIFTKVREYFKGLHEKGAKIIHDSKTHRGLVYSVYIREGKRTGEMMVIVQTSPEKFDAAAFLSILSDFPEIVSVVRVIVHEQKGTPKWWEEIVLRGAEFYREELWIEDVKLRFQVKPQAFFQPNTMMAEKIYGEALGLLQNNFTTDELAKMRVYDLYCGTGTIGIVLSHAVSSVVGVELNASAIESARENAKLNDIKNIEFHVGDVKKVLEGMAIGDGDGRLHLRCIIIDPPRNGLEEKVVEQILSAAPKAILYVSCNPATFARDVKLLTVGGNGSGYVLASARVFDQFPQTAHVETVALLKKVE